MGRFATQRGFDFINGINEELINNVVETSVILYRISPENSTINIYGESISKDYMVGTQVNALIASDEQSTPSEDWGPDSGRLVVFNFHKNTLQDISLFPEYGDIIAWDDAYFEVHNIMDNSRFGGKVDFDVSIICETHMTRRSSLNIDQRTI